MSVCILSVLNIVFYKNKKRENIILYIIFFIATATHMSHVAINILLLFGVLAIYVALKKMKEFIFFKRVFILIFLSVLSVITMGSTLSKFKHVFVVSRMAGSGMLQEYLTESCNEKSYRLCNSINEIPQNTNDFLWED
jgi:fumarate reductase subunit C